MRLNQCTRCGRRPGVAIVDRADIGGHGFYCQVQCACGNSVEAARPKSSQARAAAEKLWQSANGGAR